MTLIYSLKNVSTTYKKIDLGIIYDVKYMTGIIKVRITKGCRCAWMF